MENFYTIINGKADASSLFYQPRDMTLDLLSRQISTVKVDAISNTNELYPLLAAQSERIQRAVYDIFHRLLPITQERVSFEVAISKIVVNLPDELLSLLLEPPEINTVSRKNKQNGWAGLRAYLLSWKLVFDHFSGSVGCHILANLPLPLLTCLYPVASCPRKLCRQHKRPQYFKSFTGFCFWFP